MSLRVQSADHSVHLVDLALAATNAELWPELPSEVFGNKAAWGLGLLEGLLGFLGLDVFQALDLSRKRQLVVYVANCCQLCFC